LFPKAAASAADAVFLDLEDSVPEAEKAQRIQTLKDEWAGLHQQVRGAQRGSFGFGIEAGCLALAGGAAEQVGFIGGRRGQCEQAALATRRVDQRPALAVRRCRPSELRPGLRSGRAQRGARHGHAGQCRVDLRAAPLGAGHEFIEHRVFEQVPPGSAGCNSGAGSAGATDK